MLNELIGAVVQALFFSLVPLAVWYATARKKESFFPWIGLKKPVCNNVAITVLSDKAKMCSDIHNILKGA